MAVGRRKIRGDRAFKKLIRRLPDAVREEAADMMDDAGNQLLASMKSDVPRATGTLSNALSKRLSRKSLRLRVGLVGKVINRRLFYAYIVHYGRKAKTVQATRKTAGGSTSYQMRIRAMVARPFVHTTRTRAIRDTMGGKMTSLWDRALTKASAGATDD